MSIAETWTVKRLLEWTTDFFKKKGIDMPRLDAEILLSAAMKVKRIELYTNFETEPNESHRTLFRELVKRHAMGEPVAYLVGFKEFYSIPLKVDPNVLIPRPETELLVLETLDILKTFSADSYPVVCDVGTGSGAIAIAVAKNLPAPVKQTTTIVAIDNSLEVFSIAKLNALSNEVADRIEFCCSDLLAEVTETFDVIVGNLPYISQSEYEILPKEVKNFEPQQALLAGRNGTEIIERLTTQLPQKLKPNGSVLLECSPMIAESVAAFFADWNNVQIIKDNAGHQRLVSATRN
ncbi:MAG: peptide chain release factor N(5)-glutamine methyltransferase [Planctomycetaceae bacterium]|jgi:release factor glutamine methyltransferase|nr:peptide chain release factor N(5)-glutamine methyltransferase [Planctomycetaceae bacterium]